MVARAENLATLKQVVGSDNKLKYLYFNTEPPELWVSPTNSNHKDILKAVIEASGYGKELIGSAGEMRVTFPKVEVAALGAKSLGFPSGDAQSAQPVEDLINGFPDIGTTEVSSL